MGRASVPTPAVYPAFFFVLEKAVKSAGNAVIPTFPAHCPHGLQHLRHKRPTFAFTGESGYALGFAQRIAHSGLHGETGVIQMGALSLPSERFTRFGNPAWPGIRTANFAALGLGRRCSRRTQRACGTAMRLCASLSRRRRGPAGLRNLFRFCRNCGFHVLCSGPFRVCEVRGGITTLSALYVLLKRRTPACQTAHLPFSEVRWA